MALPNWLRRLLMIGMTEEALKKTTVVIRYEIDGQEVFTEERSLGDLETAGEVFWEAMPLAVPGETNATPIGSRQATRMAHDTVVVEQRFRQADSSEFTLKLTMIIRK